MSKLKEVKDGKTENPGKPCTTMNVGESKKTENEQKVNVEKSPSREKSKGIINKTVSKKKKHKIGVSTLRRERMKKIEPEPNYKDDEQFKAFQEYLKTKNKDSEHKGGVDPPVKTQTDEIKKEEQKSGMKTDTKEQSEKAASSMQTTGEPKVESKDSGKMNAKENTTPGNQQTPAPDKKTPGQADAENPDFDLKKAEFDLEQKEGVTPEASISEKNTQQPSAQLGSEHSEEVKAAEGEPTSPVKPISDDEQEHQEGTPSQKTQ